MLNKLPKLRQVLVRFSLLLVTVEVLIVREAVAGGIETHEMDIIGPHTSSNASSPWSVHTAQDINEAQSVISQAEGASFFLALLSHPETIILFCCRIRGELRHLREFRQLQPCCQR